MTRANGRHGAEEALTRAELDSIVYEMRTMTDQVARLSSGIVNKVLSTELFTIGTQGRITREFGASAGSVVVTHHGPSSGSVLVQAGSPISDSRPSNGRAMGRIDAGRTKSFALAQHELTFWGTTGDQLTVEVFTNVTAPVASGGVGGPAAAGVQRVTTVTRFANAGPAGVTAPGTYNIVAGRKSFTVLVNAQGSINTPTLDGVALLPGVYTYSADAAGDTLEAAVLITAAGDDVTLLELA
jgi:hypothetical protein